MKKLSLSIVLCFLLTTLHSFGVEPSDYKANFRKGVTSGYYLGFTSLADEMRELRRPSDIPKSDGFLQSLYVDFHYANQEFNEGFYSTVATATQRHPSNIRYTA